MSNVSRIHKLVALLAGTLLYTSASAMSFQTLLEEDFEDVSGITNNSSIRTVNNIVTNNSTQLSGSPSVSFTNAGNGDASVASFNVRNGGNAIDGSSASSSTTFDNFFGTSANQFLVIGDNSGDLTGSSNGGTNTGASSTLNIQFALASITIGNPQILDIQFDYVFDTNNTSNPDDFIAELILQDLSKVDLLSFTQPSSSTRGTFTTSLSYALLASAPTHLNFRLFEGRNNGSSAVGIDNIQVTITAVPEPEILTLLGGGLLCFRFFRRKSA